jgi:hypothetical protein
MDIGKLAIFFIVDPCYLQAPAVKLIPLLAFVAAGVVGEQNYGQHDNFFPRLFQAVTCSKRLKLLKCLH